MLYLIDVVTKSIKLLTILKPKISHLVLITLMCTIFVLIKLAATMDNMTIISNIDEYKREVRNLNQKQSFILTDLLKKCNKGYSDKCIASLWDIYVSKKAYRTGNGVQNVRESVFKIYLLVNCRYKISEKTRELKESCNDIVLKDPQYKTKLTVDSHYVIHLNTIYYYNL